MKASEAPGSDGTGRTTPSTRLWRARRRHDHIDAVLARAGGRWQLRFFRSGNLLLCWTYADADEARAEADSRLRALQRAGWNVHW